MFKPYYTLETGCAGYLFGFHGTRDCAVVDPHERDVEAYAAFAASTKMRISHVIETHVHADRLSGGPALAAKVGATYCLHESARTSVAFTPLTNGQEIIAGTTRVVVLHTPGHTPDSICLWVCDLRDHEDPGFVLTGETLLVGAVGFPDISGDVRASAEQLHDSLHHMLLVLPEEVDVFPARLARDGRTVAGGGRAWSTIALEKRGNPLLSRPKEEFVAALCR